MLDCLNNVLFIVRHNIIEGNNKDISNQRFFDMVTETIDMQTNRADTSPHPPPRYARWTLSKNVANDQ